MDVDYGIYLAGLCAIAQTGDCLTVILFEKESLLAKLPTSH